MHLAEVYTCSLLSVHDQWFPQNLQSQLERERERIAQAQWVQTRQRGTLKFHPNVLDGLFLCIFINQQSFFSSIWCA